MRTSWRIVLALAIASTTGCMIESAQGPGVRHAPLVAPEPPCKQEQATGSHIPRLVCQPEQEPVEALADTHWRNRYPYSLTSGGTPSKDTPGLRVYH